MYALAAFCPPADAPVRCLLQEWCPRVVTLFHRVLTCLRLAFRMETAVGNSTCVLRVGAVDAAWHTMQPGQRTTDPSQLASPRLVRSFCCKQGKRAGMSSRSTCTRGSSLPAFFHFSFARTAIVHDTQNLRHWVFCASVPLNYRLMSVESPILLQVVERGLMCATSQRNDSKARQDVP
jgi:hypothetical protein